MSSVEFPSRTESGWRAGDDPLLVADAIHVASEKERRFIGPLSVARRVIRNDIVERFDTETDPEGHPWRDWSPLYKDQAERENIGILHKQEQYHRPASNTSDSLYDAVSKLTSYEIESRGISSAAVGGGSIALVGANLPDYWIVHQEGAKFNFTTHKGETRQGMIPARPFIGVSDRAEEVIYGVLDMHVDGALAGAVRRTGQPIMRIPGIGTRFVSPSMFEP